MSQAIIEVENISKRYQIGANMEKYLSIRDEMVKSVRRVSSGFAGMFSRNQQQTSDNKQDFWALKDVSFNVQQGETVGIIGRNGAGKSTLLKILSQITPPTAGKITMRGRVASLLEVGTGFHPELTGRENVYLNGTILGMRRNEVAKKFDEIVAFAEVEKFLDTPVKRYSSGMYVRLAFAVAAHLEPEILVVDEVLAVGDATFQKKCLGKMGDVARGGRTILFVSHNMEAVLALCSIGYIFDKGMVSDRLEIEAAVNSYLNIANRNHGLLLSSLPRYQHVSRSPIFCGLHVSGKDESLVAVLAGGEVNFNIELLNFPDILQAQCGIIIKNDRDQRVVSFQSWYHSGLLVDGAVRKMLSCKVPSLPLIPGKYSVDLILSDGYQIIEKVEEAATFDIIFDDIFGTGKLPTQGQGYIALPCRWSVLGE